MPASRLKTHSMQQGEGLFLGGHVQVARCRWQGAGGKANSLSDWYEIVKAFEGPVIAPLIGATMADCQQSISDARHWQNGREGRQLMAGGRSMKDCRQVGFSLQCREHALTDAEPRVGLVGIC